MLTSWSLTVVISDLALNSVVGFRASWQLPVGGWEQWIESSESELKKEVMGQKAENLTEAQNKASYSHGF